MLLVVLPNCLAPLIVQATLGFSAAILDAAALGFLGLGAQPPTPEWGTMLADALQFYQPGLVAADLPGPGHPGDRHGVQPAGGRAARRAGPEAAPVSGAPLLDVRGLSVAFDTAAGRFNAVEGVDLTVAPGEVLCVVGESGSGKSVSMLAVMGLLPPTGRVSGRRSRSAAPICAPVAPRPPAPDRARGGDGVPGADLLAQPVLPDRLADRRGAAGAPLRCRAARCAAACWSCWARSASRRRSSGCARSRTSCPAG